ncbi:hypothetical protein Cob_v001713 [Colletotrichum orbiculare MAFF 240422]|uniref:Uncharacterized protein n=1 Tax=Colletotrichum orbiculare (strain 104-T / ATCC 96160 / CBS 514.97 / LARS 414 / MAFF 240422) TaxID=1213857 RepID=A0A484G5T4_COLOR|nr:hypothetical protein Cob_v001713 [Colletotrichum orbiculare MAFF 240422]
MRRIWRHKKGGHTGCDVLRLSIIFYILSSALWLRLKEPFWKEIPAPILLVLSPTAVYFVSYIPKSSRTHPR